MPGLADLQTDQQNPGALTWMAAATRDNTIIAGAGTLTLNVLAIEVRAGFARVDAGVRAPELRCKAAGGNAGDFAGGANGGVGNRAAA